jgi:hypothetical protein
LAVFFINKTLKHRGRSFEGIKKEERVRFYLSCGLMYAQTLTKSSVKKAPANPESRNLAWKKAGKIAMRAGIT